jgi:hypothetical protein
MSDLNRRGAGWQQTAECSKCGVHWRFADGRLKFMLKMFFLCFPLMFLSLGLVGWGLEQIPFFYNEDAVGPNDSLRFRAFPILGCAFYLFWAFFLRLLPLKKVIK